MEMKLVNAAKLSEIVLAQKKANGLIDYNQAHIAVDLAMGGGAGFKRRALVASIVRIANAQVMAQNDEAAKAECRRIYGNAQNFRGVKSAAKRIADFSAKNNLSPKTPGWLGRSNPADRIMFWAPWEWLDKKMQPFAPIF